MSLLLEALKKAELAKQNASGQQGEGTAAPADPASGLALEQAPGDAGERPLITRDRLPDITQPLEILSEDLPSAGARREASSATSGMSAAPMAAASAPATASEEDDRASARQLFEAKAPDYDPRRPFFLIVGLLGIAILGTLGYFAWEVFGPRQSFHAPSAASKPPSQPVTAAVTPPPAPPRPVASATAPAGSDPAPADPGPAASAQAAPAAAAAAVPVPPQPTTRGRDPAEPDRGFAPGTGEVRDGPGRCRRPRSSASRAAHRYRSPLAARGSIRWSRARGKRSRRATSRGRGRSTSARSAANPRDRDALLGLATIDARTQRFESAEARYLRVLELDPRDPYAQAGLISLRGQTDPLQSESRIKNMLAQQPDAAFLYFPLGNQYAAQGRWSEAQAAYFRAFSADPDNPDYAYNLAVSLDHLGQGKLALEYYRRALALAGNRAVGFNSAQVESRVRELTR